MPNQVDIFISYCPADAKIAKALQVVFESVFPSDTEIRSTDHTKTAKEILTNVAKCNVHIAVITNRSIDSVNFLIELGARWGKTTIPACTPDVEQERLINLQSPTYGQTSCYMDDLHSLRRLVNRISNEILGTDIKMSLQRSHIESVKAIAKEYGHSKPTPKLFTENHLCADRIVNSANAFLSGKMPSRDGFVPDIVVGMNSGGTFAASVISERLPNIRIGSIWIRNNKLDEARSFLPEKTDLHSPKILLVDSMLKTGSSAAAAVKYIKGDYPSAEIRLLATLVYGGWEREGISFPDQHFWPALFSLPKKPSSFVDLRLYAAYYNDLDIHGNSITEPGIDSI